MMGAIRRIPRKPEWLAPASWYVVFNAIRADPEPGIRLGCYARYSPRPTFLTVLISGSVLLMALVKFFVEVL